MTSLRIELINLRLGPRIYELGAGLTALRLGPPKPLTDGLGPKYARPMMTNLPAVRLSQFAVETVQRRSDSIRLLVRMESPTLTTACTRAGLPAELAALCGGLLASVVDDLVTIGRLRRHDFERTKRKQRVLAAAVEPALQALRLAIAASPINGYAAVAHWDAICEKHELGKMAWLLGMDTELAWRYGKKIEKRSN